MAEAIGNVKMVAAGPRCKLWQVQMVDGACSIYQIVNHIWNAGSTITAECKGKVYSHHAVHFGRYAPLFPWSTSVQGNPLKTFLLINDKAH